MKPTAQDIDDYLAGLSEEKRAALETLRRQLHSLAPGAVECIAWQLPSLRLDGKLLVAFGAAAKHCALYPMSAVVIEAHRDELAGWNTSKGTIRFQPDRPLPEALLRRIVAARIAENAALAAAAASRRKAARP